MSRILVQEKDSLKGGMISFESEIQRQYTVWCAAFYCLFLLSHTHSSHIDSQFKFIIMNPGALANQSVRVKLTVYANTEVSEWSPPLSGLYDHG